jgi:hypothetical protein
MRTFSVFKRLGLVVGIALFTQCSLAQTRDVTFAGVAFSGSAVSLSQRFPYSQQYEKQLKATRSSSYKRALAAVSANTPQNFNLSTSPISDLKGNDQALVSSLVVSSKQCLSNILAIFESCSFFCEAKRFSLISSQ